MNINWDARYGNIRILYEYGKMNWFSDEASYIKIYE